MTTPGAPAPDDRLSGYLDGELDATERAAVDALLAESPDWRAVLAEVRWTRDALRGLPWHEAPTGFWDEVARERLGVPATAPRRRGHPVRVIAGAAVAAAAVAAVLVPVEERDSGGGGGGASTAVTVTSFPSLPDRGTVQRESAARSDGDTGLLRDLVSTALDPFDW